MRPQWAALVSADPHGNDWCGRCTLPHHVTTSKSPTERLASTHSARKLTKSSLSNSEHASDAMRAAPWSPARHPLWTAPDRAKAYELLKIGHLLSRTLDNDSAQGALLDVWVAHIMPQAMASDNEYNTHALTNGDHSPDDDECLWQRRNAICRRRCYLLHHRRSYDCLGLGFHLDNV